MKKCYFILVMLLCVLGFSACGNAKTEETAGFMSAEEAKVTAEGICDSINQIVLSGMAEQYAQQDPVVGAALDSWMAASEEIGNYVGIESDKTEVTIEPDKVTAKVKIIGDKTDSKGNPRTATEEIVIGEQNLISVSTNVDYSLAELMEKAALNTLLGMGTVFAVLILISLIISLFSFIPKIQAGLKKKEVVAEPSVQVVEQISQREEQAAQEDDTELVAVIAAAIAMSEGRTSTDGLVVRSIIRR